MKVRYVDEFDRVVIPISFREKLKIQPGDKLDIFTERESFEIILKKHNDNLKSEFENVIVDEIGRIKIPKKIMELFEILEKDPIKISEKDSSIILGKVKIEIKIKTKNEN